VEKALAAEKLLKEREELLNTNLEQNDEALRVAQVRYEAGKISMLDVLQMQARTNLSRSALIDMKQLRLAQRIDLHLALGGSFEERPEPATQTTTQPATRNAS
jgi:outer membrane protein TolC